MSKLGEGEAGGNGKWGEGEGDVKSGALLFIWRPNRFEKSMNSFCFFGLRDSCNSLTVKSEFNAHNSLKFQEICMEVHKF